MINFKIPLGKINSKNVPFWLSFIFVLVSFTLGLLLGGNISLQKGKEIIKGLGPNATSTSSGIVKDKDGDIPDYLKKDVDFNLFWDVWNIVKQEAYDKDLPDTQLFYGALSGIVASLDDPHSVFFTPDNTNDFNEELDGKFEGIGTEIGMRNNILTVIAPLDNSPALRAGLRPKDLILEIDGNKTDNMSLNKAVSLIRGQSGSEVVLTVYRDGFKEPKKISVIREAIKVKSLEFEFKNDNIAYIKIRQFNSETVPLFNDAVMEILKRPNIAGIILDMRYNPGGYLQSAIDVAGEWVDGDIVVREKVRDGEEIIHRSNKSAKLGKFKTVVLVNAGSASGSEIVAGALQDLDKAIILGTQTFGKGSVQKLINLKDGSSIKLTIAKWFTPSGNSIEGDGITPDIKVEITDDDYNTYKDPQLDKAISIITGQE
ncbi:MAG: S41 family peptidase [Candidatus Buchananbacteria bacterium]|nr:S41 family peptidase [Candidatus Buchananbacteria bacterium]